MSIEDKKDEMQNAWDLFQPNLLLLNKEVIEKRKKRKAISVSIILLGLGLIGLSLFLNQGSMNTINDIIVPDSKVGNSKQASLSESRNLTASNTVIKENAHPISTETNSKLKIHNEEDTKVLPKLKRNPLLTSIIPNIGTNIPRNRSINNDYVNYNKEENKEEKLKIKDKHLFPEKAALHTPHERESFNTFQDHAPNIMDASSNHQLETKTIENINLIGKVKDTPMAQEQFETRKPESIANLPLILAQGIVIEKEGCLKVVVNNNPFKNKINLDLSIGPAETTIYNERQIRMNGFSYSIDGSYSINKIINVGLRFNQQKYTSMANYIINPEVNNKYTLSNLMINLGLRIVEVKKVELILNVARGYALENTLKRKSIISNNEVRYEHTQENEYGLNYHVFAQLRYKVKPKYAIGIEALLEENGYERTLLGININYKF